ncbi:MAG: hypothetical protein Q4C13_02030, partial [Clostridia bacterium]|nr:hypothetical protein [Clostridia bacterium]
MDAYIAIWFIQCCVCLFGTVVTRRRFEELLPAGMLGMVLFAYALGLLGALAAGVWIALGLGLLLGLSALALVLGGRRKFAPERFFTPAFFCYAALLALSAFVSYGRAVWIWDECSHWAISVKSMVYARDFSTSPLSHILFRSYPPGLTIWQYFYQALHGLFSGKPFCEWLLYGAYNAFCFALLLPFLRLVTRKARALSPLLCAALVLLPMCFFDAPYAMYESLYVDALLAILAAYAFYTFRFPGEGGPFVLLSRCLALAMLPLVKDSGLYFAAALPLCFFLSDWIRMGGKRFFGKPLLPYAACALSAAAAKLSWSLELHASGVARAFSQPVDIGLLWRLLTGAEQGYQRAILENFARKFFSPALTVLG